MCLTFFAFFSAQRANMTSVWLKCCAVVWEFVFSVHQNTQVLTKTLEKATRHLHRFVLFTLNPLQSVAKVLSILLKVRKDKWPPRLFKSMHLFKVTLLQCTSAK